MQKKVLVFESEKCIGCRLCESWCSVAHFGVTNPAKACIKMTRHHDTLKDYATYCHQCVDAPCVSSCKFEALSRDEKTAAIVVNIEKCTGCRKCIRKCPYGAPSMHPTEKYILICDLCDGDPQCVAYCPEQAIQFLNQSKADRLYRSFLINDLAKGDLGS